MASVVLDSSLREYFDDILASQSKGGTPIVVGFVIGAANEQKFQVVRAFKSLKPEAIEDEEKEVSSNKKDKKSTTKKLTDLLDAEWLSENALQAMRSIPGGLRILGLFAVVDAKLRLELQPILLKGIRLILKTYERIASTTQSQCPAGMILLNVDLITRKPSASFVDNRGVATTTLITTYQDVKLIKLEWDITLTSDVYLSSNESETSDQAGKFYSAFRFLFWQLENSIITFDKQMKKGEELLMPKPGAAGKGGKKGVSAKSDTVSPTVDVLLLLSNQKEKLNVKIYTVDRLLKMRGTLACIAYVDQKATVEEAKKAVKDDMSKSLYFRIQLHCDGLGLIEGESNDAEALHLLPRRVFAPLQPSIDQSLLITDYLFEGDSAEDAVQSLREMFDIVDLKPEDIVDGKEVVLTMDELSELNIYTQPSEENQAENLGSDAKKKTEKRTDGKERGDPASSVASPVLYVGLAVLVVLLGIVLFYTTAIN